MNALVYNHLQPLDEALMLVWHCGYTFLRFWPKTCFASAKFCDLFAEMVQGQMFYTSVYGAYR